MPRAPQQHQWCAQDDRKIHGEEGCEPLQGGGICEVVEHLGPQVVRQSPIRFSQLERILEHISELLEGAALGNGSAVAKRDLCQTGKSRFAVTHAFLEIGNGKREIG